VALKSLLTLRREKMGGQEQELDAARDPLISLCRLAIYTNHLISQNQSHALRRRSPW
jgi:hypothetical protein